LKFRIAILSRSVSGGYLFNSHTQTAASIPLMLIFELLLQLLHKKTLFQGMSDGNDCERITK